MSLGVSETRASSGSGEMSAAIGPICLIVEDQVLIGLSLEAYLEEVGFGMCEVVPSSIDALEWLVSNTPTIVILDYSLQDGPAPPWLVCCGSGASPS